MHVVVMGVAGCGKSSVAARVAVTLDLPLIEGDAFHSPESVANMQAGELPLSALEAELLAGLQT
jgi:gluconokinase